MQHSYYLINLVVTKTCIVINKSEPGVGFTKVLGPDLDLKLRLLSLIQAKSEVLEDLTKLLSLTFGYVNLGFGHCCVVKGFPLKNSILPKIKCVHKDICHL